MRQLKNKLVAPLLSMGLALAFQASGELQPEAIGTVEKLETPYPAHWIMVHDASFFHMSDGKMMLLDADVDTPAAVYKGMMNSSGIGQYHSSAKRQEHYVAETFHSRGQRGQRTDVLSIYDFENLKHIGEIELPGGKRSQTNPEKYALQLVDDDKFLLLFNLTPATSISVIDLDSRKIVNEVQIPGCALAYPTGKRGFSSLCSDGAILATQLDKKGQTASQNRSKPFFNVDQDPLFEKPAVIAGTAYFPSFKGNMQPVGLNSKKPSVKRPWSLLTDEEKAANWRPGGMQSIGSDAKGKIYILMHPDGYNGSHKDGGPEVWVFDRKKKKKIRTVKLKTHGVSIMLTQDDKPLLVVTNANMNLDVYDAKSGEFQRTLAGFGQETPFVVYPVK